MIPWAFDIWTFAGDGGGSGPAPPTEDTADIVKRHRILKRTHPGRWWLALLLGVLHGWL